jgi:hypothetical protein
MIVDIYVRKLQSATWLLLALLSVWPAAATGETVLDARPTVRVESSDGGTNGLLLTDAQQREWRVLITRRGDRYLWSSRENRELVHHVSGAFHHFIDPRGGGYVKVFDTSVLPESLRDSGPRFRYMEHLSIWLGTITYWGTSETFEPRR